MTSIVTNTSAMSALASLTATQRQLSTTQAQVSSGLAVANASDNAAYWSIGKTMSAQVAGIGAVQQGLSLTQGILSVTLNALDAMRDNLSGIKDDLVLARQAGVDRSAVQKDISSRQALIISECYEASFNGVNLLVNNYTEKAGDDGYYVSDKYGNVGFQDASYNVSTISTNPSLTYDVPSGPGGQMLHLSAVNVLDDSTYASPYGDFSYTELGAGTNIGADYSAGYLSAGAIITPDPVSHSRFASSNPTIQYTSVLDFVIDGSSVPASYGGVAPVVAVDADLVGMQAGVQSVIDQLTAASAHFGGEMSLVGNLQTFNASLSDALTSGIGSLVDADMNVASTRLQALQTQQQLGIQALSMANQNSQLILKLFNG